MFNTGGRYILNTGGALHPQRWGALHAHHTLHTITAFTHAGMSLYIHHLFVHLSGRVAGCHCSCLQVVLYIMRLSGFVCSHCCKDWGMREPYDACSLSSLNTYPCLYLTCCKAHRVRKDSMSCRMTIVHCLPLLPGLGCCSSLAALTGSGRLLAHPLIIPARLPQSGTACVGTRAANDFSVAHYQLQIHTHVHAPPHSIPDEGNLGCPEGNLGGPGTPSQHVEFETCLNITTPSGPPGPPSESQILTLRSLRDSTLGGGV